CLSGVEMRAHAMFSAHALPAGSDTLEYAWLIDMQAGALTGRITVPQVCVRDTPTHRHTDTQTHRHTDTQTHRHTDTQTHTDTHTDTDTQTHTHTHRHT